MITSQNSFILTHAWRDARAATMSTGVNSSPYTLEELGLTEEDLTFYPDKVWEAETTPIDPKTASEKYDIRKIHYL